MKGISAPDARLIGSELSRILQLKERTIHLEKVQDSYGLFREYWRVLALS